jgi:hypothetical protein
MKLKWWTMSICLRNVKDNRRKTQHQNPEFGHTQGEIQQKKNQQKSTLAFKGGMKLRKPSNLVVKLSFILSFLSPERINFGGKLSFILSFLSPERTSILVVN